MFGNSQVFWGMAEGAAAPQPEWKAIHEQMQETSPSDLQWLWEEYRRPSTRGIATVVASAITLATALGCECCVGTQGRREKLFVDWAGGDDSGLRCTTGEVRPASLFVSVREPVSLHLRRGNSGSQLEPGWSALMRWVLAGLPTLASRITPDRRNGACRLRSADLNPPIKS